MGRKTEGYRMISPSFWLMNWMDDGNAVYQEEEDKRENKFAAKIKNSLLVVYY